MSFEKYWDVIRDGTGRGFAVMARDEICQLVGWETLF